MLRKRDLCGTETVVSTAKGETRNTSLCETHAHAMRSFVCYYWQSIRYDEPECGYEESELNFALHVRMGDRRELEGVTPEYFSRLEGFMATVTQAVVEREQAAPMFHVFSEALYPCPSPENATFTEFPFWPVERDQVCMAGQGLTLVLRTGRSMEN